MLHTPVVFHQFDRQPVQQVGVWATSPFGDDYRPETALVVGGTALLLVGALGFQFGLGHELVQRGLLRIDPVLIGGFLVAAEQQAPHIHV